jgi:hypothetical protein
MDLDAIIRELLDERKRLDRLIQALEQDRTEFPDKPAKSRRGRKSMDGPARREVSERMKLYWAKRRAENNASSVEMKSEVKTASSAA